MEYHRIVLQYWYLIRDIHKQPHLLRMLKKQV